MWTAFQCSLHQQECPSISTPTNGHLNERGYPCDKLLIASKGVNNLDAKWRLKAREGPVLEDSACSGSRVTAEQQNC